MRPFLAAAAFTFTIAFASVAAADDLEEPPPAPKIAPRREWPTGVYAMIIGGSVFAGGYVIDLAAVHCRFDCAGRGKLAIPVVGYPMYLADDGRRAEATRRLERDRAARARGDGCENSALGCDTSDKLQAIGRVLAWIPTILQVAGASAFLYGAVATAQSGTGRPKRSRPVTTWQPTTSSIPGGATLGVLGTF